MEKSRTRTPLLLSFDNLFLFLFFPLGAASRETTPSILFAESIHLQATKSDRKHINNLKLEKTTPMLMI